MSSARPRGSGRAGVLLVLRGEWDIACLGALEEALGAILGRGLPAFVDLAGVTFIDSRCIWTLVAHQQFYEDDLVLRNPSRQVELSVAACGLKERLRFVRPWGEERFVGADPSTAPKRWGPRPQRA